MEGEWSRGEFGTDQRMYFKESTLNLKTVFILYWCDHVFCHQWKQGSEVS